MKITIATMASPDALDHETLSLGFFSDERPPKGFGGFVDWRLNGLISRALAQGRIRGDFGEKAAFAFPGRLRISRLILFGFGPLEGLTPDRLYRGGYGMAQALTGLAASHIALPVPCAGRGALPLDRATEALFTGLYDGFLQAPDRLEGLRLEIPAQEDFTEGLRAGLDLFRRHAADPRVRIGDGDPAEGPAGDAGAAGVEALRP